MLTVYHDALVKDWLDTLAGSREEAKANRALRRYQLAIEKAKRIDADREHVRARAS